MKNDDATERKRHSQIPRECLFYTMYVVLKMEMLFPNHSVIIVITHIGIEPMVTHDGHREAGVFHFLNCHLTVAVRIYARDIACGLGSRYGFQFTFCEAERFVHFIRVHVVGRIGNDISFDIIGMLLVLRDVSSTTNVVAKRSSVLMKDKTRLISGY